MPRRVFSLTLGPDSLPRAPAFRRDLVARLARFARCEEAQIFTRWSESARGATLTVELGPGCIPALLPLAIRASAAAAEVELIAPDWEAIRKAGWSGRTSGEHPVVRV